jgi:hypothetical protein
MLEKRIEQKEDMRKDVQGLNVMANELNCLKPNHQGFYTGGLGESLLNIPLPQK